MADEAKRLWDEGLRLQEIGKRLGFSRWSVLNALDAWYAKRGLVRPKASKCKTRLKRTPAVAEIADEVMKLFQQGVTYEEIGRQLGTNRAKVARAIAYWHEQRELPIPNGKQRHKKTG